MNQKRDGVRSMTGFGQGMAEADGLRIDVELRGVNHRYLDLKIKLPPVLASYEQTMRGRARDALTRGRVDISFSQTSTRSRSFRVEVNRSLVGEYLSAASQLKKGFRLRGTVGLETILALPGAVSVQEDSRGDSDPTPELLDRALDQALSSYDTMRTEEGTRLVAVIRGHLDVVAQRVEGIEMEMRGLPETQRDRLNERIGRLMQNERGLDEGRLAQEVALLVDRSDITEEVVRLKGYIEQARNTLERAGGAVGKPLDFVMQEMNREANTISSKSDALGICQAALGIRSEVEKIREQVQNLE